MTQPSPETLLPMPRLSAGELRFERIRQRLGLILAPLVFLSLLFLSFPVLNPEAHRLAAIMGLVITLWISEALPMPVTALLGAALCILLKVAPAKEVFAPFADPLMFLFIGSFILARALFIHHLDRRLAFGVLSIPWIGASPKRLLFAFGALTAFMSAWISNTATTAMMYAIGLSILTFLFSQGGKNDRSIDPRYATGLMLMTSFAASIGGLATPVGTPPNLIGLGFIRDLVGVELPFFKWMLVGVPIVALLFAYLYFYLSRLCPAGVHELPGSTEMIRRERDQLGNWTRGQYSTLFAFLTAVSLWVVPGVIALVLGEKSSIYLAVNRSVPEAVAALIGALLLFLLPGNRAGRAITWEDAARIDWGVVLLYGGGVALGSLSFQTGLAEAVGRGLAGWLPLSGDWGLVAASAAVALLVSETTSNTASANMVIPVVIALAKSSGVDPLEPALAATMAASLGFMLPVSTPCNAIVYASGYIPLGRMIRYGVLLDIVGVIVVVLLVKAITPLLR
jgi:sodium-dependent dicarboxylate transporter 2/3/5